MNILLVFLLISQSSPGIEFLRIGINSRAVGLGNTYTAISEEPSGMFYNPAGISSNRYTTVSGFHGQWFLSSYLECISGTIPLGHNGTLGLGLRGIFTTGIEKRTEVDPWDVGEYSAYFMDASITYAHRFGNLGLGAGIHGLSSRIESEGGFTGFLDAGLKYSMNFMDFGFSILNLGPSIMNTGLPLEIKTGLCLKPFKNFIIAGDLKKISGDDFFFSTGMEYILFDILSMRIGYNNEAYSSSFSKKLSGGVGIKTDRFSIDYTLSSAGDMGITHLFNISYMFKPEEPVLHEARVETEAMMSETYIRQGIGYYRQGKYEEALNSLDLALIWKPDDEQALEWIEKIENEFRSKKLANLIEQGKEEYTAGDYLNAINLFQRALAMDSSLVEIEALKEKAEKRLKEGISGDIADRFDRGVLMYEKGEYLKSYKIWKEILKEKPDNAKVNEYLERTKSKIIDEIRITIDKAEDYLISGNLKRALEVINAKLREYPEQENLTRHKNIINQKISDRINEYLKEGRELFKSRDYYEAEKAFQKVLEYAPENSQANNYIEKIKNNITRSKQKEAERLYILGIEAYTKNNFELAIEYWERLKRLVPRYPNVNKNIERAKIKLEELNK